jgi:hypothetical protein
LRFFVTIDSDRVRFLVRARHTHTSRYHRPDSLSDVGDSFVAGFARGGPVRRIIV